MTKQQGLPGECHMIAIWRIHLSHLALFAALAITGCMPSVSGDGGIPDLSTPDLTPVFPPGCSDGVKDNDETDIDCGGSCKPCGTGKACNGAKDCASGLCANKACLAPSCTDGIKNGDETDVDCGGSCAAKCAQGKGCNDGPDCQSGTCLNDACAPSLCSDGKKDGMETDIDCGGGSCPGCAVGKMCSDGTDCMGGTCLNNVCTSPATCTDKMKDGNETDVDCGGTTCPKCADGKMCQVAGDCVAGVCSASKCGVVALALSFAQGVEYQTDVAPWNLAAADFNRDGKMDVAASSVGSQVDVLLGDGKGALGMVAAIPFNVAVRGITAGDFNGDQITDIAGVDSGNAPTTYVFSGKGDGTFNQPSSVNAVPATVIINGAFKSGGIDLVMAGNPGAGIVLGDGKGSFSMPSSFLNAAPIGALAAADMNGDGQLDLAVFVGGVNGPYPSGYVGVLLGKGDGTFMDPLITMPGLNPLFGTTADFNMDGKPDVIVGINGGGVTSVLLGKGDGTFQAPVPVYMDVARSFVIADFDLDGKTDVALTPGGSVSVYLSKGDGTFQAPYSSTGPDGVEVIEGADMNGDGKMDIVGGNHSKSVVQVFLNTSQ